MQHPKSNSKLRRWGFGPWCRKAKRLAYCCQPLRLCWQQRHNTSDFPRKTGGVRCCSRRQLSSNLVFLGARALICTPAFAPRDGCTFGAFWLRHLRRYLGGALRSGNDPARRQTNRASDCLKQSPWFRCAPVQRRPILLDPTQFVFGHCCFPHAVWFGLGLHLTTLEDSMIGVVH
jgi:hypothetical protein